MSDKVIEGYLNPDGSGEGDWAAPTAGSTPRPHDPPPWIRPWGAMYLHAPGTDDVLQWQENLDYACYAVNHIEQAIAERDEALRLLDDRPMLEDGILGRKLTPPPAAEALAAALLAAMKDKTAPNDLPAPEFAALIIAALAAAGYVIVPADAARAAEAERNHYKEALALLGDLARDQDNRTYCLGCGVLLPRHLMGCTWELARAFLAARASGAEEA